jgi:hypothetical protein
MLLIEKGTEMIKCRLAVLVPIVVATFLVGCGGEPPPAQPSGSATATSSGSSGPAMITSTPEQLDLAKVNVCGLLTRAEVEEAVGAGEWSPTTREGRAKACDFTSEVTLIVGPPDMWGSAIMSTEERIPISGLGDEAITTERTVVAHLHRRAIVKLSLFNLDTPFNSEIATELVRKVIGRLP